MARLNTRTASSDADSDGDSDPPHRLPRTMSTTSRCPGAPSSSDEENRDHGLPRGVRVETRKSPIEDMSISSSMATENLNKRRRLTDKSQTLPSQAVHQMELEDRVDKRYYDPDQDEEERRVNRKSMRELARELNGEF